jgi:voltage-gated sodium channel
MPQANGSALAAARARVLAIVESRIFTQAIVALILVNAAVLGLETLPAVNGPHGNLLAAADRFLLSIFVGELALRLFAHGTRFFRDPWSLFDAVVIGIALAPSNEAYSVLRAARVLRVLRLASAFPQLKRVVQGLIGAIPGLASIAAILGMILYVFAVMGSKLFGGDFPRWFGDLPTALFTLFQVMTLEGWGDIAREIKQVYPYAWIFFLAFILLSTFTVLNLVIAVIVDTMQRTHGEDDNDIQAALRAIGKNVEVINAKVDKLVASPPSDPAIQSVTPRLPTS